MRHFWILMAGVILFIPTAGQAQEEVPQQSSRGCAQGNRACALMHSAVWAQAEPPTPPAPEAHAPRRRHLEQFRILKLLELLDLNKDQEMEFLVEFKALREKQMVLQQERERMVERLADGLREDTLKEADISRMVARIFELRREYSMETENFFNRVSKGLTPEQEGKLVVFQERFEYELLGQVKSFRERGKPGQGGARPSEDLD